MELLKGIKNIIFDLGGVVINLDYKISIEEFKKLGIKDFDVFFAKNSVLDKWDRGRITVNEFLAEIKKHLPDSVTNEQIINAWNAMLLDLPKERAELLKKLRKKYRTFLLSNTNELHLEYHFKYLQDFYGVNDLSPFFEKLYFSNIIGMRKPDAEVYEFVLSDSGLKPEQTLFIDDHLQNVESAIRCGIKSYYLQYPSTIMDIFPSMV